MGGRAPCCDKSKVKRGAWSPAEDIILISFIQTNGHTNWRSLPKQAGLLRCGKSCRLRWINYLRPDVKRGNFTPEEENTIIKLHASLGNRWSKIASRLPGRTDNEIKNLWNTHLKKRSEGIIMKNNIANEEIKGEASSSSSSCCTGEQNSNLDHQQHSSSSLSAGTNQELQLSSSSSSSCGEMDEIIVDASMCDIDIWGMLDDLEQVPAVEQSSIGNNEELQLGAVEWLKYFENELELAPDQTTLPTETDDQQIQPSCCISGDFPFWPNSSSYSPHHNFGF